MIDISVTLSGPALASKPKLKEEQKKSTPSRGMIFHLPTHISRADNSSRSVRTAANGVKSSIRSVGGKLFQWLVQSRVNASGFGLNTSQMRGKEKLKIPPTPTILLLKQSAEVGRLGLCTFTGDLLLLLTRNCVGFAWRQHSRFRKFSSV